MRDYDTAAAIKARWDATPAITTKVIGGLHEPPVAEKGAEASRRPPFPYATLVVQKDSKPNQVSTCGEIDFRRVKIVVYGTDKAAVAAAGKAVDEAFSEQSLTIADADHMRTEPPPELRGGTIGRADKVQEGQVWKATLEYRIWTSRPSSS